MKGELSAMEKYEALEMEIITFACEDVITASNGDGVETEDAPIPN